MGGPGDSASTAPLPLGAEGKEGAQEAPPGLGLEEGLPEAASAGPLGQQGWDWETEAEDLPLGRPSGPLVIGPPAPNPGGGLGSKAKQT